MEAVKSNAKSKLYEDLAGFYDKPYEYVIYNYPWNTGTLRGFDGPDTWQRDVLEEIDHEVRARAFDGVHPVKPLRFATASGHGIGKSALVAWIVNWIMDTRPFAKGIVTANTAPQLSTKTWAEISKWTKLGVNSEAWKVNSGKGNMKMYSLAHPDTWRVDGQTCREEDSESFAGLHAATSTPFYIFDEGSAVPDKIYEVAEGGLTDGEPMIFVFGNYTRNVGRFHQCFTTYKKRWSTRQIDSRNCKLPNKEQIKEWEEDYGENSDFFRVRVRGLAPSASDMQFISRKLVHEAQKREAMSSVNDPFTLGVDVARGGKDDTVLYPVKGMDAKTFPRERMDTRDTMKIVSKIQEMHRIHNFDAIFIDATGIGGPVYDRCLQLNLPVFAVTFSETSPDPQYGNVRAYVWGRLGDNLKNGLQIPEDDPDLETQILSQEYTHDGRNKIIMIPKDVMKRKGIPSPDDAEALALAKAYQVNKNSFSGGKITGQKQPRRDYNPLDMLDDE